MSTLAARIAFALGFLLSAAEVTGQDQCPKALEVDIPTAAGAQKELQGAYQFDETGVWSPPTETHWVLVLACGGGGGGSSSGAASVISFEGTARHKAFAGAGGENATPQLTLLGPLTQHEYLIVVGRGGPGGAMLRSGGDSRGAGLDGCPTYIVGLDNKEPNDKTKRKLLLTLPGGSKAVPGREPFPYRQDATNPTPPRKLQSGPYADSGAGDGGGGGGLEPGGASVDGSAGAVGGACAGGAGGGLFVFRGGGDQGFNGGAGGHGRVILFPLSNPNQLIDAFIREGKTTPAVSDPTRSATPEPPPSGPK